MEKSVIISLFFLLSLCNFIFAYDFSSMQENEWVKLNPEILDYHGSPCTTEVCGLTWPDYEFPWNPYSGMVYDNSHNIILMFGGGGHGGRGLNDVWLYNFSENTWNQQYLPDPRENYPNPSTDTGLTTDQYLEELDANGKNSVWWPPGSTTTGRPWTSHSYDQLAWDPVNREMLFYGPNYNWGYTGTGSDGQIGYYQQAGWSYAYDPVNKVWRDIDPKIGIDYAKPGDIVKVQMGAMEYYPPTEEVIFRANDGIRSYDVNTKTWDISKVNLPSGHSFGDSVMVYDNINQQLLMFSGDYGAALEELWAYHPETKTFEQKAMSSISPPAGGCGAAFDSLNGVMIIWGEGDTGELHPTWAYDTMTDQWTKMNPVVEPPSSDGHVFGHMIYSPKYNAVILVDADGETWAYRYDASVIVDVNPPSRITGLTAIPVSYSQVNLAWTPATDDIGVAGYRIERCQGGSCSNFAQVGVSGVPSYSSTGLTANTTYSYRVRAVDAAGNLGKYSPLVSITTLGYSGATSWVTHTDPVLATVQPKPPVGEWWTDPDLGGRIMRIGDYMDQGERAFHVYSDMTVWSANMEYYALIVNNEVNIYNWPDRTLKRGDVGTGTATFFFSLVDDDIIYWLSAKSLRQYNVSSDVISTVHDFSGIFSSVRNNEIKTTSDNGQYMAIPGILPNGSGGCARYDFKTDTLGPVVVTGTGTECAISPDGDYLLPLRSRGFGGITCFDALTGSYIGSLDNDANTPHMDVIKDSSGKQWVVYQLSLTGKLRKVSIPSGEIVDLLNVGYIGWHVSSNQRDGDWVVISTYSNPEEREQAFSDEVIRVYLDSTESNPHIERMLHHRSYSLGSGDSPICYWKQPHASVSPDGNYALLASSWHEECIVEPIDKVDPYILDLSYSGSTSHCLSGADSNSDDLVSIDELIAFIEDWKTGSISINNVLEAIAEWKSGC